MRDNIYPAKRKQIKAKLIKMNNHGNETQNCKKKKEDFK